MKLEKPTLVQLEEGQKAIEKFHYNNDGRMTISKAQRTSVIKT
jgi:hypothetical protein